VARHGLPVAASATSPPTPAAALGSRRVVGSEVAELVSGLALPVLFEGHAFPRSPSVSGSLTVLVAWPCTSVAVAASSVSLGPPAPASADRSVVPGWPAPVAFTGFTDRGFVNE
jgi:hypothetical protein